MSRPSLTLSTQTGGHIADVASMILGRLRPSMTAEVELVRMAGARGGMIRASS